MTAYEDMIHMKRPDSKHPRMPIEGRATQFASFRALTGYGDEIDKSGESFLEMVENEVEAIEYPELFNNEIDKEFDI